MSRIAALFLLLGSTFIIGCNNNNGRESKNTCEVVAEFCSDADQFSYKPSTGETICLWFCSKGYESVARSLYIVNGVPQSSATFTCPAPWTPQPSPNCTLDNPLCPQ